MGRCKMAFMRLAFLLVFLSVLIPVSALADESYRAIWVDTFNTNLNNHGDVVTVVENVKAANANALFVQVRRRGDSWVGIQLVRPAAGGSLPGVGAVGGAGGHRQAQAVIRFRDAPSQRNRGEMHARRGDRLTRGSTGRRDRSCGAADGRRA